MGTADDDDLDPLDIAKRPIEGAGNFRGRPDGKVHGRGMLGLVSAIPPAPRIPTIRGVRMLAPTVPSERPRRNARPIKPADLPPLRLPEDAWATSESDPYGPLSAGATDPLDPQARRAGGSDAVPTGKRPEAEPARDGSAESSAHDVATEETAGSTASDEAGDAIAKGGRTLLALLVLAALAATFIALPLLQEDRNAGVARPLLPRTAGGRGDASGPAAARPVHSPDESPVRTQ